MLIIFYFYAIIYPLLLFYFAIANFVQIKYLFLLSQFFSFISQDSLYIYIKYKSMEIKLYFLFSIVSFSSVLSNLLLNGDFQLPVLPNHGFSVGIMTYWSGSSFQLTNYDYGLGYGQFVDLCANVGQNGYLQQSVTLVNSSPCSLTFLQAAVSTNFSSYIMEIYWNGTLIATKIATATGITSQCLVFNALAGTSILKFKQVGDPVDWNGMLIDQLNLTCNPNISCPNNNPINTTANATNNTTNTTSNTTNSASNTTNNTTITSNFADNSPNTTIYWIIFSISMIISLPFNKIISVRYAYLFFQDLWMYYYADVQYQGVVQTIFQVDVEIQQMKQFFLDRFFGWDQYKSLIPISDHQPFTKSRFLSIQGSSSVLIDCNFSFFVYTVSSNIILVLFYVILFKATQKYKISQLFRKYSFVLEILLQVLLEGNVIYFTYVCFSHLQNSWAIKFTDKAALIITIIVFFILCFFSLTFYFIVGLLKDKACYFIYNFYRCHWSYVYLTAKNLLRNFVRGAIFFYLDGFYSYKLLCLGIVEGIVVITGMIIHLNEEIFISKLNFILEILYLLLFIVFNLSLYFEYLCEQLAAVELQKEVALQWQRILIFLLIFIIIIVMILDLIPLEFFKKEDQIRKFMNKNQKHEKHEKVKKIKKQTKKKNKTVRYKLQQMIAVKKEDRKPDKQNKTTVKIIAKIKAKTLINNVNSLKKKSLKLKSNWIY